MKKTNQYINITISQALQFASKGTQIKLHLHALKLIKIKIQITQQHATKSSYCFLKAEYSWIPCSPGGPINPTSHP
jgi:hypothetical protein